MAIRAIAFDSVETLFSLDNLVPALDRIGAAPGTKDLWFTRLLRDAFALTAAGGYRPFAEVADGALGLVVPSATPGERQEVLGHFDELDAHPDARPALELVAAAGLPCVILTNGGEATTRELVDRNGLGDLVDDCISVDEVRRWKPAPEPYLHAARRLDLDPSDLALVAVHGWDVDGAHFAGLATGWCSRLEGIQVPTFAAAEVAGDDLDRVVADLLAR